MNQEPLPQIHLIRDTDLSVFAYELHIFAGDFLRECEFNMRSLATNTGADSIAIMGKNHIWLSDALFAYCSTADLYQMISTTEFIGARAFLFHTGKEGLQKLKEQEYQLVVLDVMMPGMDGFETLEEIRKENSLPILMFTSKNDSISKVRGLRAGADDYLTKPFDMDELIARIASLIRRYEAAACHRPCRYARSRTFDFG